VRNLLIARRVRILLVEKNKYLLRTLLIDLDVFNPETSLVLTTKTSLLTVGQEKPRLLAE
jgi:hypothetical protein